VRAAIGDLVRLCTVDLRRSSTRTSASKASVVHLVPSLAWGGAERLACTIHRLATTAGWRSRIDAPGIAAVRDGVLAETGDTPATNGHDESTLHGWARAARARIERERPDVVHAHLAYPDRLGHAMLAARGRPLVATFQLLPDRNRYWSLDELLGERSDHVLRVLSRLPTRARFIAVSRGDHERLAELIPARRLARVANAPPFARRPPRDLEAFAWPEGKVRLLSAGRLHAQKGYDRLLRALAQPAAREVRWHWLLAGDGPERGELESAAVALGIRDRLSFASEYPASMLYPTADVVLAPSRWEGMPLVPMEAVEAGTPVVASDIEPHRELFDAAPETLLPSDESHWPEALARTIGSRDARDALRVRQTACLAGDARESLWRAYESLYRSLAGT
jgi:glycosyltransferase involved in cell wall biosynthesis